MDIVTDPKEVMADHQVKFGEYAEKVLRQGVPLSKQEAEDRDARLEELFIIGRFFKLTQKEIVVLALREALKREPPRCDCRACRVRTQLRKG